MCGEGVGRGKKEKEWADFFPLPPTQDGTTKRNMQAGPKGKKEPS